MIDLLAGMDDLPEIVDTTGQQFSYRRLTVIRRLGQDWARRGQPVHANPYRPRCGIAWHAWDIGWQKEFTKPQEVINRDIADYPDK